MASRALIAIGVNKAGKLTPLQGAARGALDVFDWARQQEDVYAKAFTDIDGQTPVTRKEIFEEIQRLANEEPLDHLCVYFAGHGFVNSSYDEILFLSGAPEDAAEAINLTVSCTFARLCGIEHVTFISDACRQPPTNMQLMAVNGSPIMPNLQREDADVAVDVLYATKLGRAAYEETDARNCNGIFTGELLKAIRDPVGNGLKLFDDNGKGALSCEEAGEFLRVAVPVALGKITRVRIQKPDLRIESRMPKYLAKYDAVDPDYQGDRSMWPEAPRSERKEGADHDSAATVGEKKAYGPPPPVAETFGLGEGVDLPVGVAFRLLGSRRSYQGDFKRLVPDDETGLYVSRSGTAAQSPIPLKTSSGILPLVAIPHYIATVDASPKKIKGYWYEPAERWKRDNDGEMARQLRAEVSRRLHRGELTVSFLSDPRFADRIRRLKAFDPMLGVIAAYVYAESGKRDQIASVRRYMLQDLHEWEVFDVLMLARIFGLTEGPPGERLLSPFPMLARGWAYITDFPEYKDIAWMQKALVPGIWTQFDLDRLEEFMPDGFARWW